MSRALATGLALALASLLVYNLNLREVSSQDTIPTRLLPVEILRSGRLDLDRYFPDAPAPERLPYWVQRVGGHYRSSYPLVPALLALPVYLPGVLWLGGDSWAVVNLLAKLSASLLAALSVLAVYLAARRLWAPASALAVGSLYAFATTTWSVSSQGLWGHAAAQLGLGAAIFALLRLDASRWWSVGAGLAAGVMVASRLPTVLMAGTLALYALRRRPGAGLGYLAGLVVVPLLQGWWHLATFGALEGGYAEMNRAHAVHHGVEGTWSTPIVLGLAGILVSPSRGLFVYSPVLVLAVAGAVITWRGRRTGLVPYLAVGAGLSLLMFARFSVWWGGHSFGPRLLSDVVPALALLTGPAWERWGRSRPARPILAALLLASVAIQGIGAFCHPSPRAIDWNASPEDVDARHERLWDWQDSQLLRLLRNGPVPPGFRPDP